MRIDDKISSVTDNLSDLSNYVTILDSVQKTVNSTNTIISSKVSSTDGDSVSLGQLDIKLQKLESICSQLTTKLESFDISALQQYENRLNNIMNESTATVLPTLHNSRTPVGAIPSTSSARPLPLPTLYSLSGIITQSTIILTLPVFGFPHLS